MDYRNPFVGHPFVGNFSVFDQFNYSDFYFYFILFFQKYAAIQQSWTEENKTIYAE